MSTICRRAFLLSIFMAVTLSASTSFAQAYAGATVDPKDVVNAVDSLTPPLPSAGERKAADVLSWGTALTALAIDTKASWDAPNRQRAFALQGVRLGVTYGVSLAVKKMVARARPCAKDDSCGASDPSASFYSAHAAVTFQAVDWAPARQGTRLAFTVPLAVTTAGLRVAAGKHWLTDTLVGAGAGLLTSRIR